MATIRAHTRIDRSADEVWKVVSDAGSMQWFPGVDRSEVKDDVRTVTFGEIQVDEKIVTSDDELRRFQYRITGGALPVENHLGTIDVFDVDGAALVVYSTEIEPDGLRDILQPSISGALDGLKKHLES